MSESHLGWTKPTRVRKNSVSQEFPLHKQVPIANSVDVQLRITIRQGVGFQNTADIEAMRLADSKLKVATVSAGSNIIQKLAVRDDLQLNIVQINHLKPSGNKPIRRSTIGYIPYIALPFSI